ncbi:MAG TPA: hypothetical protein VGH33_22300 [Isosphaeraceae bacterium]
MAMILIEVVMEGEGVGYLGRTVTRVSATPPLSTHSHPVVGAGEAWAHETRRGAEGVARALTAGREPARRRGRLDVVYRVVELP